jgi:hypothetical protein
MTDMQIAYSSISFEPFEGSGPREASSEVTFANPVSVVGCFLTGFEVSYAQGDGDHHLGNVELKLRADRLDPWRALVTARFGLRDASGDWDDKYQGTVYFNVVGD